MPFITAISHLMGSAEISALKNLKQACVLYTTLIGQPSTGKTTAMSIVRDAVFEVEEAVGVLLEDSKLLNSEYSNFILLNVDFNF